MSLKLRWILTLLGCAVIVTAAIAIIAGSDSSSQSASALLRSNRRTRLFIRHDQAPHSAPLPIGREEKSSLTQAIDADLRARVRQGELRGPAQSVLCRAGEAHAERVPYLCTARAGGFPYPFLALVDRSRRQMTWCKFDPAPAAEGGVPLSPRCKR